MSKLRAAESSLKEKMKDLKKDYNASVQENSKLQEKVGILLWNLLFFFFFFLKSLKMH